MAAAARAVGGDAVSENPSEASRCAAYAHCAPPPNRGGLRRVRWRAGRDRRPAGFTLLEVMLALTLAALVGLAATRLLSASLTAEPATSQGADRARALDMAADLLGAELRRAGSEPYPPPTGGGLDAGEPALKVTLGSGRYGDVLAVRYLDDRVQGGPLLRDLRFDAAVDGRGVPQLYRAAAGGNRQPLVQGIDAVRVVGWVDAAGAHPRSAFVAGALRPWLLLVELGVEGSTTRRVAAPLPSRPRAAVVMAP